MNNIPNLCKFLHFNQTCPVCNEPLSLYMYVVNSALWRTVPVLISSPNEFRFEQFKSVDKDLSREDSISLIDNGDTFDIKFGSSKIYQKAKSWNLYFIVMCNELGIEDKYGNDFVINPYEACYYGSSPFMEMKKKENNEWQLEELNIEKPDMFIRDEIFVFKSRQESIEKVYILNMDYESDKTQFYYYSTTEEQRNEANFEPKVFSKELPMLTNRPQFDIEQRDKLLSRFDSWILLS